MRASMLVQLLAASPAVYATLDDGKLTSRDLIALERSIQERGLVDDIWKKIKNAATCTGCQVCYEILLYKKL